ncbi:PAS domain S-box protein [Thermus antranikianii]|uniref:PAS domain S-box protein n=1 Tax=Thermus antranikianii TaxID=88190 RepID=A0ABY7RNU4_9DEIN|nr:HD domain-containing phosphohydrolase [Thermus antranikianii]WCM39369.1 PAS domain S-box protein [Thermus antranikianii]
MKISPSRVVFIFSLFALLWILVGDRFLHLTAQDLATLTRQHSIKESIFAVLSILLVYLLAKAQEYTETQRRKALEASEKRFRALVENSRELIYILDAEGYMRYASPNVAHVLGYDPLGYTRERIPILSFVHPEDRLYAEAALEDLVRHPGTTQEYSLRILDHQGGVRYVRVWGRNLLNDPAVQGIVLNIRDETEEVRLKKDLEAQYHLFRDLLETLPGVPWQILVTPGEDPLRAPILYLGPQAARSGYGLEALLRDPGLYLKHVHPEDLDLLAEAFHRAIAQPGTVQEVTFRFFLDPNDPSQWRWLKHSLYYDEEARHLTGYTQDVTEEKARERALRESEALFRTLAETAPALILMWQEERLTFANEEAVRLTGYTREELASRPIWEFVHPADRNLVRERGLARLRGENPPSRYTFRILTKEGEVRWLDYSAARVEIGGKPAIMGVGLDITEAKERELALEAFAQVSVALRQSEDLKEMMEAALEATLKSLEAPVGSILLYDADTCRLEEAASRGWLKEIPTPDTLAEEGLVARAFRGEVVVSQDLKHDPRVHPGVQPLVPEGWSGVVAPLLAGKESVGALTVAWPHPRTPTPAEVERVLLLAEAIGNAVRRASLRRKLARRVEQLEALRAVDQAIAASLDLDPTLEVFFNQVMRLPLDAAALFLYNPREKTLELRGLRGFYTPMKGVPHRLLLGQGHIGQAALSGETVFVPDLTQDPGADAQFTLREGLVAEKAYPLFAKGRLLGVLAVFTRRPWDLSPEEEEFLEALIGQGAVALDNALTFQELLKSQRELEAAYDLTLWGWAKAVELRDQETAGHTERVTELTLRLARALGVPEEDLEHIRRGAILHDVGKIGIPDSILLKPGPLTEEEWAVMKKHPVYAYEWLSGIPFLKKALEIPYCHHERWDGSGYPRGLKGLEIPLSARIFAVVDVYDALTSDRPYRKAWPREKALAYIQEQAGKQFDPEVVEAFLRLVAGEEPPLP